MLKRKLRSFGIIEAMVASIVIILVLTGAVALIANLVKASSIDASYQEAETIAEEVFSGIEAARATRELEFVAGPIGDGRFPIECFSNSYISGTGNPLQAECLTSDGKYKKLLPFYTLSNSDVFNPSQFDSGSYFTITQKRSATTPSGFFKFNTSVDGGPCLDMTGVDISQERCRKVTVTVKWEDKNGPQTYEAIERFTDWQR